MDERLEQVLRPAPLEGSAARDARAVPILAKTIFRELKHNGLTDEEVIRVATELLAQVTSGLRSRPR